MKRQTLKTIGRKLRHNLAMVIVLLLFFLPAVATMRWAGMVVLGYDPRNTIAATQAGRPYNDLKPFNEPMVTITFDDGWESIYSQAFPVMQKYDVRSTQYLLGGEFDNPLYLSEAQVKSLQSAGHDIAGHTMSHPDLTGLNNSELTLQLRDSKQILESKFGTINDFASPINAYNDRTVEHVKKYYRSHRNTDADPKTVDHKDVNVHSHFDEYNIIAYTVRQSTEMSDLKKLVEYAREQNGWLVLSYHQIDDSGQHYAVTPEVFEQHMRYLTAQDIKLPTMREVLDIIRPTHEEAF